VLNNSIIRAKGIWKGYQQDNLFYWVLKGLDLNIFEDDLVAVLGEPGSGKTTLLKVLSYREIPQKGQVYFQDRLLVWGNEEAIVQMQEERVWLLSNYNEKCHLEVKDKKRLKAILLDEPDTISKAKEKNTLSEQLRALNRQGIAVVLATCDPELASQTRVIYKLKNGQLEKLTGKIRGNMHKGEI
jgi:ABC-type lipoprotein export system ATPase subunit